MSNYTKENPAPVPGHDPAPTDDRPPDLATLATVDLASYADIEPHRARDILPAKVWGSVLRQGTLAILGGESKARKSWFALSLAMHSVTGKDFCDEVMVEPGERDRRCLILDFELLEANIMSRFLALAEKFEDDEPSWRAIWSRIDIRCHRHLLGRDEPWLEYLVESIRALSPGDIAIVDCLQALPLGDANDPTAVRRFLGALQAAATASGACVVVVDHFSKSVEARGMNRISGSVAKAATPDAILLLEADGDFLKFSTELRMDPPRDPTALEFTTPSEGFRVVPEHEREERAAAAAEKRESEKRRERSALLFPNGPGQWRTIAEMIESSGKTRNTVENWLESIGAEKDASQKTHKFRIP